ncbi:hypothetical protein F9L16_23555 [Agarivorans sp. B2Z047]|uniref:antiterminator Q family protein n=1 Tax=Agarivorans sp. B2Z047 TaxID=2652721 RepID=UPI00128CAF77|nr:antiterminator Q family protein [Agarivorans sp. B2Z047]MPW31934.1 hypothetical protein [Agarivorans sp. B2Z047]UQN41904.1 hypothetical protein LQZ07_19310 [Agarivorans sp. B2Z047]
MQIESIEQTRRELLAWGAKARSGLDHVGYPSENPIRRFINVGYPEESNRAPEISDEWFLEIDNAVTKLGCRYEKEKTALVMRYVMMMSVKQISEHFECGTNKANSILRSAEVWIDARLFE